VGFADSFARVFQGLISIRWMTAMEEQIQIFLDKAMQISVLCPGKHAKQKATLQHHHSVLASVAFKSQNPLFP